jgi:hypothetical protein
MPRATSTGRDVAQRLLGDGHAIVSGMMSAADVRSAAADLGRVLESVPKGRNPFEGRDTQRVYALFAKTRTFDRAAVHPLLLDALDQVLAHYQLSAPVGIRIGPGEQAQIPGPPVVVNTMWPLDEFTSANRTARPRLGVILEYAAGWLRPQENHCLAVPRSVVRQLPERLQELLGYNIYPPFLGYVDGVHPRRVLSAGD